MTFKKYKSLSDETLNALVDNEFPAAERSELLAHLQTDKVSKERACEISYLKDRVKTAYSDIPQPTSQVKVKIAKRHLYRMVSSVFFALVVVALAVVGLNGTYNSENNRSTTQTASSNDSQRLVVLDPDGRAQNLSQNNSEELRVVFHVSSTTRLSANELLDDIEGLLEQSIKDNQKIRVEVVAHAEGLDLLRERLSTEKPRITALSKQYPELTFVACLNTIDRIKRENGIDVKLISEAESTQSGVAYVVMRLQQGWLYIQV
ncbi:hypothetical protein [uncultured Cocleimonas sp.]|uniref:hypothetical protein n=1 Tax=uncultured Cocleimonas sp. TaxID=1051587 RepID=UPI0026030A91|nr:hypothetical protein [uncultured Cocleimonas sp.]